jgi:hypothetical protein
MRKALLIVVTLMVMGATTFCVSYLHALNSEGFQFASEEVRRSKSVEQIVGRVRSVELPLSGPFDEKFVGDRVTATMRLIVIGTTTDAAVVASATKLNGRWQLTKLEVNDRLIDLGATSSR